MSPELLARAEDATLNASASPQQRWLDGWLLRFSPGKARRARCAHALGAGQLPLAQRLADAEALYAEAGLPFTLRITPFTQPPGLQAALQAFGLVAVGESRVLVCPDLANAPLPEVTATPPAGLRCLPLHATAYADAVGALRGSPPAQRQAHTERLLAAPVRYEGWALVGPEGSHGDRSGAPPQPLACAQIAVDGALAGLYDVFTAPAARGQGLSRWLCGWLLARARAAGAAAGYLQVDAGNEPALHVYRALGFADGYGYHYLERPDRLPPLAPAPV
jgi:GNAT superfamily N-acetyltransferase